MSVGGRCEAGKHLDHRFKLNSDHFGDEAGDQIGSMIVPSINLRVSITYYPDYTDYPAKCFALFDP